MNEQDEGALDPSGVRRLYDRIASVYDLMASPYELVGGWRLAARAVGELRLSAGDTVVDLGTGTGWNLERLAEVVGPTGRVIGVDISPAMLQRARRRLRKGNIATRVELVEADITDYRPPPETRAIIATFAVEMLPGYHDLIGRLVRSLPEGGRIAVTGLRNPDRWPEWVIRLGSWVMRPFGVTEDYRDFHPWEAVEAHTTNSTYAEALGGVIYLASGSRPGSG